MALMVDEDKRSRIDDPSIVGEMLGVIYGKKDNRPAWVGGHMPATSVADLAQQVGWVRDHYNFYLNFVKDYVLPSRWMLDIGCGAGQNTAMLSRYGNRAVGVDSDPDAISFAMRHNSNPGVSFVLGEFPCFVGTADYIFCIETMEHVPYDKQFGFIDAMLDVLTPGGMVFITTPDEEAVAPPHIGIWTERYMKEIMNHVSDNIIKVGHFDNKNSSAGFVGHKASHHAMVLAQ